MTSKKRREGFGERLRVLTLHFANAEACFAEARKLFTRKQVASDDILDAMVGAVTARYSDCLRTLPDRPERDAFGLPMEMVYADLACPFCRPAADRGILDEASVKALWDAYPVSPGHALIAPKRHVETWFEATAEERAAMIEAIERVKEIIEREHKPTAYNIGINSGRDAGQTVPHLHLHVIPRYRGDVEDPRGGIRNILPAKARWWEQE
jgi:diadenosine tetraphosphate (Ap4A) HIT family hydrolase